MPDDMLTTSSANHRAALLRKSAGCCRSASPKGTAHSLATLLDHRVKATKEVISCLMIPSVRRIQTVRLTPCIRKFPSPKRAQRCRNGSGRPLLSSRSLSCSPCSREVGALTPSHLSVTQPRPRKLIRWHQRTQPHRHQPSNNVITINSRTGGCSDAPAYFASCPKAYPC